MREATGDLPAVEISAVRVVDHDKHGENRVLHGGKPTERGDVTSLKIARGLAADLLRRAGLARNAVALDRSL